MHLATVPLKTTDISDVQLFQNEATVVQPHKQRHKSVDNVKFDTQNSVIAQHSNLDLNSDEDEWPVGQLNLFNKVGKPETV